MFKINRPFMYKDDDDGKINEQKWQLFLKDFKVLSSWKWLDNKKGFINRKGFEIFDYHRRFSNMNTCIFDHVTGWEVEGFKYIVVSQPYLKFSNVDRFLKCIVSDKEFWKFCIDYNYLIDIYFTNKYNWHTKNVAFITFTNSKVPYITEESKKSTELIINVHTLDDNKKEIVTPYKIGLNVIK